MGCSPQDFRTRLGPGTHNIYVFARNAISHEPQLQIGNPIQISITGTEYPVDPWHNQIANDCRSWKDKSWQSVELKASYIFTSAVGCKEEYPDGFNFRTQKFWVLESTNERENFSPVYDSSQESNDFSPLVTAPRHSVPMWNYSIQARPSGVGYRAGWTIDKINGLS